MRWRSGLCTLLGVLLPLAPAEGDERALVAVEAPPPGTVAALHADGVLVVRDLDRYLLAVVGPEGRGRLDARGLDWHVLDPSIEGATYYTVVVRGRSLGQVPGTRRVLRLDDYEAVLRADPEEAVRLAEEGFPIARVFLRPVRPPRTRTAAASPRSVTWDPLIDTMVQSVSTQNIDDGVQRLQDFATRYCVSDSARAAADWIASRFEAFGVDSVALHEWTPTFSANVVGVLPGRETPHEIILIGGHYDSITPNHADCPGADDNGSGTSLVLECARVLSRYEFDRTVVFVAFGAEEVGLIGSEAYATAAAARGERIIAMINVDMVGYVSIADVLDLDLVVNLNSQWLRDLALGAGTAYVPQLPIVDGSIPAGANSDHASFWAQGFDAVMLFEDSDSYSPFMHTNSDVVGLSYHSSELATASTQLVVAMAAELAGPLPVAIGHRPLPDGAGVGPYRVVADIVSVQSLQPDSLTVVWNNGTDAGVVPLLPTGVANEYRASLPGQVPGTRVVYHLAAEDVAGQRVTHPREAPLERHSFYVGAAQTLFRDEFETGQGWTVGDAGDDATSGFWLRADPVGTSEYGLIFQPEDDHTPGTGAACFVTGNATPGAPLGVNDVDGGKTTLLSPVFDVAAWPGARARYHRWYVNDTWGAPDSDVWIVDVSSDGGATWATIEDADWSDRTWRLVERDVAFYVSPTSQVRFRFVASDDVPGSIVEAAVDDFELLVFPSTPTGGAVTSPAPAELVLERSFPNPSGPVSNVRFVVPEPGRPVTLRLLDVAGRVVATVLDSDLVTGSKTVRWDGRDDAGRAVASGVYFWRLDAGEESRIRKTVHLR